MKRFSVVSLTLLITGLTILLIALNTANTHAQITNRFAIIGDFGSAGQAELDVANLVKSWNPELIITTGDNNYSSGEASTIDQNIGQYYHDFIYPYTGSYGAGAIANNFFPALGNHDWVTTGAVPYLNYFTLPGNERYYDFVRGNVHFFAIDSDSHEPDGISSTSVQAMWLKNKLAISTSPWRIVYLHHAPYSSSSSHGSNPALQWPYKVWGASAVIAGHDHDYERIVMNGFPYMVNGLGGSPNRYGFGTPVSGSVIRYNSDWGAQLVEATNTTLTFKFITRTGVVIDTYTLTIVPTNTPKIPATSIPMRTMAMTRPPQVATLTTPTSTPSRTPTPLPTQTSIPPVRFRPAQPGYRGIIPFP